MTTTTTTPWTGLTAADYHARLARENASKPRRYRMVSDEEAERMRNEELADEIGARCWAQYGGTQAGRR